MSPERTLEQEQRADAIRAEIRLHAAAPELLEALQELLESRSGTATRVLEAQNKARAVISKATGQE